MERRAAHLAAIAVCVSMLPVVSSFMPLAVPRRGTTAAAGACRQRMTASPSTTSAVDVEVLPALKETPPLKVGLMVEPTPFTHVSGYSNRYKEMLTYLRQAGDNVDIITDLAADCSWR